MCIRDSGEGHVRIALVENEHRIRQAARNIKKFLSGDTDSLHNVIPIPGKSEGAPPVGDPNAPTKRASQS